MAGRHRFRRLPVLAALALIDKTASQQGVGAYASAAPSLTAGGSVSIGREDLFRVRTSLGRIAEELNNIVGVIDANLGLAGAPPPAPAPPPMGRASRSSAAAAAAQRERVAAAAAAATAAATAPPPGATPETPPAAEPSTPAVPPGALSDVPTEQSEEALDEGSAPAMAIDAPASMALGEDAPRLLDEAVPMPREEAGLANDSESPAGSATSAHEGSALSLLRAVFGFVWAVGEWLFWGGIFLLDTGIVIGMQVFLESIGRKRGGSSIMGKKNVASAMAVKAGGTPGAPIPTPSGSVGRESTQRLSVLLQEEVLAALLAEHWGKVAAGLSLATLGRLPVHILDNDSVLCHMLINLKVMLRCMSLVMLLIRDDVTLPKREKVAPPPQMPRRSEPMSPRLQRRPSGQSGAGDDD